MSNSTLRKGKADRFADLLKSFNVLEFIEYLVHSKVLVKSEYKYMRKLQTKEVLYHLTILRKTDEEFCRNTLIALNEFANNASHKIQLYTNEINQTQQISPRGSMADTENKESITSSALKQLKLSPEGMEESQCEVPDSDYYTQSQQSPVEIGITVLGKHPHSNRDGQSSSEHSPTHHDAIKVQRLEYVVKFKEILHKCEDPLIQKMNTDVLLPLLNQEHLLTSAENKVLTNSNKTRDEKNRYLLSRLPEKCEDTFELFVRCLEREQVHLDHHELAALLKKESIPVSWV